jgi:hypothetical protein
MALFIDSSSAVCHPYRLANFRAAMTIINNTDAIVDITTPFAEIA